MRFQVLAIAAVLAFAVSGSALAEIRVDGKPGGTLGKIEVAPVPPKPGGTLGKIGTFPIPPKPGGTLGKIEVAPVPSKAQPPSKQSSKVCSLDGQNCTYIDYIGD